MNPELLKLLHGANRARKAGISVAEIDRRLAEHKAPPYAELLKMAKTGPKHEPMPVTMLDQLHSAASGATLSGFDDIIGALAPPPAMGERSDLGDRLEARSKRYASENPGADLSARIGGGAALGLATSGMFPGAVAPLTRATVATGMGAGMGGIQGGFESEAETPREFAGDVARGAGMGAMFGLGGSAAAELATGGLPALGRLGRSLVAPEAAGRSAGMATIRKAAEAAGITQAEFLGIMESLEGARPGLPVPADASASLQRTLRANVNDAAGNIDDVLQSTAARAEGAAARQAADLRRLTGVGTQSTATAKAGAQQALRTEAKALYGPLEEAHKVLPDDNFLRTIRKDIDVAPIWNKVKPRGGKELPGFPHYQALVNRMEDAIQSAKKGGEGTLMRKLIERKGELVARLEELVPGYQAANRGYAQSVVAVKGFDKGANWYTRGLGKAEVEEELNAMLKAAGPKAAEAYAAARLGMVNKLVEHLLKRAGKPGVGREFVAPAGTLTGRADAIKVLFKTHDDFEEFVRGAVADNKIAATAHAVSGNSTTAQQTSDLQRIREFLKMDLGSLISKGAQRAKANTISELLAGRRTRDVADILAPRRFPGLQPGIAASGTAPAGLSLMDYLERNQ